MTHQKPQRAHLGSDGGGVGFVPMLQLQMDGVRLMGAQTARVTLEAAMMLFDVPYHRLGLLLLNVASGTLKLRLAFLLFCKICYD